MPMYGPGDVQQDILLRASVDRRFRKGLLTDPRATIEKTYGQPLPPNLRLKFVTKDPDCDAMFVLPDLVTGEAEGEAELARDNLDRVSGGKAAGATRASRTNNAWWRGLSLRTPSDGNTPCTR